MQFHQLAKALFSAVCAVTLLVATVAKADLVFEPTWKAADYTDVRVRVVEWLEALGLDEKEAAEVRSYWPDVELREIDGSQLLDRTVETITAVNGEARQFVRACSAGFQETTLPDAGILSSSDASPFVRDNLALFFARWLGQRGLYDEVIETLEGIRTEDVVDPGSLLFYRSVAHHQLVHPEESRAALVQLLEHEDSLPHRYRHVARLLSQDLKGLKDESLDHIARRMNDVRRRLDLGRAGDTVQIAEQRVIESLDKLIKKLEEQSQESSSSSTPSSQQGAKPLHDSRLPTMKSPMQVDQKDIGNKSGWGDLPPKQREEALQQIGRDYPAHYRELIEQYFRELADESVDDN